MCTTLGLFFACERAPQQRAYAEDGEVIGRDARRGHPLGLVYPREIGVVGRQRREVECAAPCAPVDEIRRCHAGASVADDAHRQHQLLGVRERQRPQQDTANHAEDGRVGTDAEGECEDGDDREAAVSDQLARGVAEVLEQGVHYSALMAMLGSTDPARSAGPNVASNADTRTAAVTTAYTRQSVAVMPNRTACSERETTIATIPPIAIPAAPSSIESLSINRLIEPGDPPTASRIPNSRRRVRTSCMQIA